jgi:hypothetical protein
MTPRVRRKAAMYLLVISLVLAPLSMLTWAKNEPPTTLLLSWLAITLTMVDVLATTDVRVKEDEDE